MQVSAGELTEARAKELCKWRYEAPYDVYNMPDWSSVKAQNWAIADASKRKSDFRAVFKEEEFIGFFRWIKHPADVTIGLGLRPDACGKGFGRELVALALEESRARYGEIPIRLEVRDSNLRAIRCYQHMGFREIGRCIKPTPVGESSFIVMELGAKHS